MNYANLEVNDRKCKITKIALFAVIAIIIISIISIYVNNHSDNKIIRNDIANLYNYTETMSNLKLDIKKELNDILLKSLKGQEDLKKLMIRKTAIEFLNKIGFNQNRWYVMNRISPVINYNEYECFQTKFISIDFNEIFEKLLKIDYDKFIVSFAYFSDNYEDNFKAHPIYKLINETLEFDYELLTNISSGYENTYYMMIQYGRYIYHKPNFINKYPYKQLCRYPTFETSYARQIDKDVLSKIYDEYEYISRIISFTSISPQRFL